METLTSEVNAIDALFSGACSQPVQKTQGPERKIRHYERQRKQKMELEQEIATLSEVLQQEQAKKKKKVDKAPSHTSLVWEVRIKRHVEARLVAEAQKRWLEAAIRGKIELIADLKVVVRQHMNIASLIAAASPDNGSELFLRPSDDLLYSMDTQDINDLYEQTSQALWILSNHIHRQVDREEFQAFDDIETTQAVKFRIMRRLFGGEWASLKQRITTHQFVEKHRVVIVFKSLVAGEGPLSGIQTDETGWITLQPSSTGHGTVVELCLKQVPLHLNSPMPEPAAQQFNDMLKSVVQESNLEIFTAAEALLLEYAMIGINLLARRARRR